MLDPIIRDAIQSRAVELLRTYLPALKPQGRQWVTHCPFHDDTTPSFVVSPDKGLFHGKRSSQGVLPSEDEKGEKRKQPP